MINIKEIWFHKVCYLILEIWEWIVQLDMKKNLAFKWSYIILFTEILHPEKHKHFDHDSLEYVLIFLLVNILSNTLQTMKQMEYKMQEHISLNWTLWAVSEYLTFSHKT